MKIITDNYQARPKELTAEWAVQHMFNMEEDHVEKVDDYLIKLHTRYLEDSGFTESYRKKLNFYFIQLRLILQNLKKMERQLEAEENQQPETGNVA